MTVTGGLRRSFNEAYLIAAYGVEAMDVGQSTLWKSQVRVEKIEDESDYRVGLLDERLQDITAVI
jgi:hypothetical protein